MSAASTPTPYPKSSDSRSSGPKYTPFWPLLVFFLGVGALTGYQVNAMQDRLDELSQAVEKMDGNVKRSQYVRAKFFAIAKDILALTPKNANAQEVATHFKLHEMEAAQPALFAQDYSAQIEKAEKSFAAAAAAAPAPTTNSSLLPSAPTTDAAPTPESAPSVEPAK